MTKPLFEPSLPRKVEAQRWGSDQLFRRPPPPAGIEEFCIHCYDPTVYPVTNTTTYETFLSFTVPGHEVKPGRSVYVQWTCTIVNASGGPVQPSIQWVWGTSGTTFEYGPGFSTLAPWPDMSGIPFGGHVSQMWAVMLQRQDTDLDDGDGNAYVQNPCGYHPLAQPCLDPTTAPTPSWDDINFTIDQLVELQIKWDIADPDVAMLPDTALAMCYGADMLVATS